MRSDWIERAVSTVGLLLVVAAGGCGANVSSAGHGSGSHGGLATPHPHEITKGELLAAELITAGAVTAIQAARKECPSMCIAPATCDRNTGLCKVEQATTTASKPTAKPKLDPLPAEAEPTCEGLCLPGERCVINAGKQDCVTLDKLPPRH